MIAKNLDSKLPYKYIPPSSITKSHPHSHSHSHLHAVKTQCQYVDEFCNSVNIWIYTAIVIFASCQSWKIRLPIKKPSTAKSEKTPHHHQKNALPIIRKNPVLHFSWPQNVWMLKSLGICVALNKLLVIKGIIIIYG